MDIYSPITGLLPRKFRRDFNQMVMHSNIKVNPNKLLGFMLLAGIAIGIAAGFGINEVFKAVPIPVGAIAVFIAIEVLFYFYIVLSIDSKAKFVENVLPDALQLMSSNIRAGLTTDKALLMAARPEFGPLAEEIRRVGKETMTGSSLADALTKMNLRIKSDNLAKTLDLIVNSIKSGGKLADLLDQTSTDIRDQQIVQKEITASVLMYAIFVFIAIGLGAPLLFAMSSFLVTILTTLGAEIGGQSTEEIAGAPVSMTSISISSEFLGSLVIGLILKGNARDGLKYAPVLIILSVGLFLLGYYVMSTVVGGMMGLKL
jgi:pilus assembly protein TadC